MVWWMLRLGLEEVGGDGVFVGGVVAGDDDQTRGGDEVVFLGLRRGRSR